jgi:hypothetical protein
MKAPRFHSRPEAAIQERVTAFLKQRGWVVEETHGNVYQTGLPDLFAWHLNYGFRWIDVKNPDAYRFTKHQCQKWTTWEKAGLGVWIMTAATEEEYGKLFQMANFRAYWKPHYDKYLTPIAEILQEFLD